MLYLAILIILVSLIYHYDYRGNTKRRFEWYAFCCFIFICIAGLRYRLGLDSTKYTTFFSQSPDLISFWTYDFDRNRYGRGFMFISAIAKTVSDNFVALQIILSIFVNSVVFKFIYKNTSHIFFAITLYALICYFPFNFEVLRESCAVCMLLIGWIYFLKNNWVKYYICAIIAVLFHISGALLLILPIFYLKPFRCFFRMGKMFWISCGLVFGISYYFSAKFFDTLQLIAISDIQNYASGYANGSLAGSSQLNMVGIIAFFLRNLVYPFISITLINKNKIISPSDVDQTEYREKLEYMFCWLAYVSIMTLFIQIFYRFNNYFFLFGIIAVADVIFTKIPILKKKYIFSFGVWILLLLPYLSIYSVSLLKQDGESGYRLIRRYYPYSSVFTEKKDPGREKLFRYFDGH